MYLEFYGLQDYPFAITPDPAFLYLSGHHREALGHLLYGTGEHGGFVQLTGEVGTGKTTLIRTVLEQDQPELDVALCLNPRLTVHEFLAEVCDELGVDRAGGDRDSLKMLVDALNSHLLETHAAGRRTVLIVDEAQNLSPDVLEQLRLLTNLETHTHKLMRIILVGQPELESLLQRPDLRQLAQRITARYHLRALNRSEAVAYIRHRLRVVGGSSAILTDRACSVAYECAGGVPRLINTVCERALMGGYSAGLPRISARVVRRAAREALPAKGWTRPRRPSAPWATGATVLVAGCVGFALHYGIERFAVAAESSPRAQVAPAAGDTASEPHDGGAEPEEAVSSSSSNDSSDGSNDSADGQSSASTRLASDASTAEGAGSSGDNNGSAAESGSAEGAVSADASESQPLPEGDADIAQLLRLWGVFGEPVDVSCRKLSVGDLRCVRIDGAFGDLRRFNRPALLALSFADGERDVLLNSLDDGQATLVFGGGTRQIDSARLKKLWTGRARLIWRQPIEVRVVKSGSVGNAVVWVRRQLARVNGVDPDHRAGKPSPVYDDALADKVSTFQRQRGLNVDGVVGPRTIMALNNREPPAGTPLLADSEGG